MRLRRLGVILSAAVLAVSIIALLVSNLALSASTQNQGALIGTLITDNTALRKQVLATGQKPVAPPPSTRVVEKQTGATGATGPAGPQGLPGSDSTVPGPAGSDGKTVVGPPGADGKDGTNGTDGKDGDDGQPPQSWTYSTGLGVTKTCNRDDPFDPAHPTYTCR